MKVSPLKEKQEEDDKENNSSSQETAQTKTTQEEQKTLQSEQEEQLKKNYEEFMKIIEKEQTKQILLPQGATDHLLKDLFKNSIDAEMNKVQKVKCIESISFSSFNPVPPYRKMVGDIFYLTIKTLDTGEHGITCCINGFYKNDNIEKSQFSPEPTKRGNPCFSYTLVGCIYQLSQVFGKNLDTYINSILQTEPYFLTQPALPVNYWIVEDETN